MLFYLALIYKKFNKNTHSLVYEDTHAHNLALHVNKTVEPDKIRKLKEMKVKYLILFSKI